jgi:transcriptional regulator with XRE-family HTH domain
MRPKAPEDLGAVARQARIALGLSQTELGAQIGASRYWVASFEKGNPGAELGRVMAVLSALGIGLSVEADSPTPTRTVVIGGRTFELPAIVQRAAEALAAAREAAAQGAAREASAGQQGRSQRAAGGRR